MKNEKKIIIVAVVLLVSLAGTYFLKPKNKVFGGVADNPNFVSNTSVTNTSTAVGQPTLVAARNYGRLYGRVVNLGAAPVFLYFQNFASPLAASTTVKTTGGVVIYPATSTQPSFYDIAAPNLIGTDVWATSTVSGINVSFTEGI